MLTAAFEQAIAQASEPQLREAVRLLLRPHASPVFGAAKTVEHEVAALKALKVLGYINSSADEYELVESLRITKAKARSLLYQASLREDSDEDAVKEALRRALYSTRMLRDNGLYLIEVADPLTMDRLRRRVRSYGYLSDGSFSGSIAKIPEGALIRLIEELIPEERQREIQQRLLEAGMPDTSVAGLVKSMLANVGRKALGDVGEQIGSAVGQEIHRIMTEGWLVLKSYLKISDD